MNGIHVAVVAVSVDAPALAPAVPARRRRGEAAAARLAARLWRLPAATTPDVLVTAGLRVRLRDGVDLVADRYAPVHGGDLPTLLVRNPYGRRVPVGLCYGRLYAERGFQVVVVRNRRGAGGTSPHEAADRADTLEWLHAQPWFSGRFAVIDPPGRELPGPRPRAGDTADGATAPVLLRTGWDDRSLPHVLERYRLLRAAGQAPALTVGPRTRAGIGSWPERFAESLDFLRGCFGEPGHAGRTDPVRVFVLGERRWRGCQDWPPPGARPRSWYLQPAGGLSAEPPPRSFPDGYRREPVDRRRRDALAYTGAPLDADLLVAGPVRVELFASCSRPYTDFVVRLCDVSPSGRSVDVCGGVVRAGPTDPADAGGVRSLTVHLGHTAWRFPAGHRPRLLVAAGAHPRPDRGDGPDDPAGPDTAPHPADQAVYHDPRWPSAVILPIA